MNLIMTAGQTSKYSPTLQRNRKTNGAHHAVFNFAKITVVPYNTNGKAYFYIIAEHGIVEKKGTYVNGRATEIVLDLLRGKGINPKDEFFKQKQK